MVWSKDHNLSYPSPSSLIFVPGSKFDEFYSKALKTDAHAIILDLEDSVHPSKKEEPKV